MSGSLRKLFGYGLRRGYENYCLRASLIYTLENAYRAGEIKVVFDIGANKGEWASEFKKILPGADFYLFEANPCMRDYLEKTEFWYKIAALSDKKETRSFFSKNGTGDSFYLENSWISGYRQLELETEVLSDLVKENNIPAPDFVKIDTQGSEIDIIKGGLDLISAARFVLSEMPLVEYNKGAPTINDYLSIYKDLGFAPILVSEIHRKNGSLAQLDMLLEKKA